MSALTFTDALRQAEAQARRTLDPELYERLSDAVSLVKGGHVFQMETGTWTVDSSSRKGLVHSVNGVCSCEDAHFQAPQGLCKHRISVYLARRVAQLMQAPAPGPCNHTVTSTPAPVQDYNCNLETPPPVQGYNYNLETPPLPEAPHGIDARHIVMIQGKPFVKFAGLLDLAHRRGLTALSVDWSHNSEDLSLAHAVAVFPFGTFEESADASPASVGKKVALHWRRVALTRAKARALRDALGVDLVAVEELADE
jgi:hypothetical protein